MRYYNCLDHAFCSLIYRVEVNSIKTGELVGVNAAWFR